MSRRVSNVGISCDSGNRNALVSRDTIRLHEFWFQGVKSL